MNKPLTMEPTAAHYAIVLTPRSGAETGSVTNLT